MDLDDYSTKPSTSRSSKSDESEGDNGEVSVLLSGSTSVPRKSSACNVKLSWIHDIDSHMKSKGPWIPPRPVTLVLPDISIMTHTDLMEPCVDLMSDAIPKVSQQTKSFEPRVVYYCDVAFDGTTSRIPPSVPIHQPMTTTYHDLPPSILAADNLAPSPIFYAHFESGNLLQAVRIGASEYDLALRADIHTEGYQQWFYFSVTLPPLSLELSRTYRFNINNLSKNKSLYTEGMRPLLFDCSKPSDGWRRCGAGIRYAKSTSSKSNCSSSTEDYMTLSFTVKFPTEGATFLLAHSYPYTYSDHLRHVSSLTAKESVTRRYVKESVLCHSIGGRPCHLLAISDWDQDRFSISARSSISSDMEEAIDVSDSRPALPRSTSSTRSCSSAKEAVIITGRVHPGESTSSWVMRGVIDYLTSDLPSAIALRERFIFYVVPMLNPDGVALGNNRANLSGDDLNRQYANPDLSRHPTVFHLKKLVMEILCGRQVNLYLDLHNHSKRMWSFVYGLADNGIGTKKERILNGANVKEFVKKVVSYGCASDYLSFKESSFDYTKGRSGTGRVVMARNLGISFSFTLETSFCGPTSGRYKGHHFNIDSLLDTGRYILLALLPPDMASKLSQSEYCCTNKLTTISLSASRYGDESNFTSRACAGAMSWEYPGEKNGFAVIDPLAASGSCPLVNMPIRMNEPHKSFPITVTSTLLCEEFVRPLVARPLNGMYKYADSFSSSAEREVVVTSVRTVALGTTAPRTRPAPSPILSQTPFIITGALPLSCGTVSPVRAEVTSRSRRINRWKKRLARPVTSKEKRMDSIEGETADTRDTIGIMTSRMAVMRKLIVGSLQKKERLAASSGMTALEPMPAALPQTPVSLDESSKYCPERHLAPSDKTKSTPVVDSYASLIAAASHGRVLIARNMYGRDDDAPQVLLPRSSSSLSTTCAEKSIAPQSLPKPASRLNLRPFNGTTGDERRRGISEAVAVCAVPQVPSEVILRRWHSAFEDEVSAKVSSTSSKMPSSRLSYANATPTALPLAKAALLVEHVTVAAGAVPMRFSPSPPVAALRMRYGDSTLPLLTNPHRKAASLRLLP